MQTLPALPAIKMEIQSFRLSTMRKKQESSKPGTEKQQAHTDKKKMQQVIPYYPPVQLPPQPEGYIKGDDDGCW
ncbi:MAG TPA: hypothetical protein PKC69_03485 [Chitinophagaceae bacterium]|nr:hypothetical protein [Chitinophagaceae bacterium]